MHLNHSKMSDKQGPVLTLTAACDSPKVASWLKATNKKPNFAELLVRGVCFDENLCSNLTELINRNERKWECMEILNCEGQLEEPMSDAITHNNIKQLRLVNMEMGHNIFLALGKSLEINTSLSFLRLTTQLLSGRDVAVFVQGLKRNKTLESLDFRWSSFDDDGVAELAKGLRENKTLKCLQFNGCSLTDEQMAQICRALKHHPSIQEIDLNGNVCGSEASAVIADLLRTPGCKLQKLDLGAQRASDKKRLNTAALFAALEANTSLQVLDISSNLMNDDDAICLAKALCTNSTLKELYIARNKISATGISTIARNLPNMRGLIKLSVWGNGLNEAAAREFLQALYKNRILECLTLFREFSCSDEINYLTCLNRGGRRIFESETNNVPLALWPHLLERVNKRETGKRPSVRDQKDKVDAIYHLIRGPALFHR